MIHLLLFLGLSFFAMSILILIQIRNKKIEPSALLGLFLFGVVLSIPFILVEHLSLHLKYYFVILAFIGIELAVVSLEHKWKYLHDLIHHNIKTLRLLSFFIVSLGFTYSELSFYVLHSTHGIGELITTLPLKGVFALFIHTVLTSSASLVTATESIVEHVFLFFLHYLKLVFISVSHYMYMFLSEHKSAYLLIPFIALNLFLLFRYKKYIDHEAETVTV